MAAATQQEVDKVVSAYEVSLAAVDYADTLVFEMRQYSGTDYTMVWTEPAE